MKKKWGIVVLLVLFLIFPVVSAYYELCIDEDCTTSAFSFSLSDSPIYLKSDGGHVHADLYYPD
ncbi:MAG: hypothetical protein KKB21_03090, partial [Nanoarchaeota archaeon]|nr:hypothetical protein [Nanoarchaeota archaeon]